MPSLKFASQCITLTPKFGLELTAMGMPLSALMNCPTQFAFMLTQPRQLTLCVTDILRINLDPEHGS